MTNPKVQFERDQKFHLQQVIREENTNDPDLSMEQMKIVQETVDRRKIQIQTTCDVEKFQEKMGEKLQNNMFGQIADALGSVDQAAAPHNCYPLSSTGPRDPGHNSKPHAYIK